METGVEVALVHDVVIAFLLANFMMGIFFYMAPKSNIQAQKYNVTISGMHDSMTNLMNSYNNSQNLVKENDGDWILPIEIFINWIYKGIGTIFNFLVLIITTVVSIFYIILVLIPDFLGSSTFGGLSGVFLMFWYTGIVILTAYVVYMLRSMFLGHRG